MVASGLAARAGAAATHAANGPIAPPTGKIRAAFVLDEGATVIDFAGPWETFQDAVTGDIQHFELFTVASRRTIQTTGNMGPAGMKGLTLTVDHVFPDAPQPSVIVIGAQSGRDNPLKLQWIRSMAAGADVVMSVCTGAFILAATGLLNGLSATTHHDFYDDFEEAFPKVKLIRDRRFVDNGKFISAGGLTSGIDAALHVVGRYFGSAKAQSTATYMEHYSSGWRTGVRG